MFNAKNICLIVLVALLVCISFILCMYNKIKNDEKIEEKNNLEIIDINAFEIKDRIKFVKNNTVYIGENLKELENDFYDIKISALNSGLEVTLNKLWRYKVNKDYIEDEYLIEIVDKVVGLLNVSTINEDVSYELYKYIKQNFLKVKNHEQVEKLELEEFRIHSKNIEGECVIYIERKINI
ncbi:MAG: hypothetical protein IKL68_01375 [Clostridia bacterium]|nr:hypothetical protein [Clostridia bacterium]